MPGEDASGSITAIPMITYYQKTYALSLSNNDQKAIKVFKQYESTEKVRQLQAELRWVANGQVYVPALDGILTKKRKGRYKGYSKWAKLMTIWLAQAKI